MPPVIVPPIPQYEVQSHPAGARLYLFDPHHPEQSLEGLLTARCTTPCKLPQSEVKEGSVLILVKEAHRSVRLFADEVQTGALRQADGHVAAASQRHRHQHERSSR